MQENLSEAERRIEEARQTQAESLDLGDLGLRELPASLGKLQHLRNLYLGMLGLNETGEPEWYFERAIPELVNVSALSSLSGLQSLNLVNCAHLRDISALSTLSGLKNLDLSFCLSLEDVSSLSTFSHLQSLDLMYCTNLTDISALSVLSNLQSLDLSNCMRLVNVSALSTLSNLKSLKLSECSELADISALSVLLGLQSLDLSHCSALTDISALLVMSGLQSLNIHGCHLALPRAALQALASHPCLIRLSLDEALDVPREVLSHSSYDNCLPRLRAYFFELHLGAEAENEVKVFLLGNGRVGKTQLCRRFRGQSFDDAVESTHGVQIWREDLRIRTGDQEQVFQVNWWDFGGQDIYHGTHALFLRSRAVFLILWTPQLENRQEYMENGISMRNQPLGYWLDYVRTLAGEGSPVIVVQSQCDRFADRKPDPSRPDGFGFFECCPYSAKENLGRETLEGHLREAIRYLLERNGMLEIGHGRAEVRRRLYAWRSEDQEREPEERQHRTLTLEEFRALCDKVGSIVSWEHALDYFHHTGVVFYQPDLFSSGIVLDQDWALDAVYAVFHRSRTVPLLREYGRFTRADLAAIVWQKHSVEEQRLFLGLMKSCGVCFACGKTADGEARYIAPDLLPPFETVVGRLYAWKEETGAPALRLEYRFFHPAVIQG